MLTPDAIREALAQHSDEVFLLLVTLTHASFGTVRLVNNPVDITSRGHVYVAYDVDVPRPSDQAESLAALQLTMSNISRDLIGPLRGIGSPVECTIELVTASAPDTVQEGPFTFDIDQASYTAEAISARLVYEPVTREPFPAGSFTPQGFPALFGAG